MKMSTLLGVAVLSLAVSAPTGLVADEHEKKEETYIYATYFYCDTSMEEMKPKRPQMMKHICFCKCLEMEKPFLGFLKVKLFP